jgi:hypothetical protein
LPLGNSNDPNDLNAQFAKKYNQPKNLATQTFGVDQQKADPNNLNYNHPSQQFFGDSRPDVAIEGNPFADKPGYEHDAAVWSAYNKQSKDAYKLTDKQRELLAEQGITQPADQQQWLERKLKIVVDYARKNGKKSVKDLDLNSGWFSDDGKDRTGLKKNGVDPDLIEPLLGEKADAVLSSQRNIEQLMRTRGLTQYHFGQDIGQAQLDRSLQGKRERDYRTEADRRLPSIKASDKLINKGKGTTPTAVTPAAGTPTSAAPARPTALGKAQVQPTNEFGRIKLTDSLNVAKPVAETTKQSDPTRPMQDSAADPDTAESFKQLDDFVKQNAPPQLDGTLLRMEVIDGQERLQIADVSQALEQTKDKYEQAILGLAAQRGLPPNQTKRLVAKLLAAAEQDPNRGIVDMFADEGWSAFANMFDDSPEEMVQDAKMTELVPLVQMYQQQIDDIRKLGAWKAAYGTTITPKMLSHSFDANEDEGELHTVGQTVRDFGFSFLEGTVGWLSQDASNMVKSQYAMRQLDWLDSKPTAELKAAGLGNLFKIFTGDYEGLPVPMQGEMKELLMRYNGLDNPETPQVESLPGYDLEPSMLQTVATITGQMLGNIKGGSFKVASSSLKGADYLIRSIGKTSVGQKALASAVAKSPLLTGLGKLGAVAPELRDASHMAMIFGIANVLDEMPNGFDEGQIALAVGTGYFYGMTGTGLSERVFYPLMRKSNRYLKAIKDPTIREYISTNPQALAVVDNQAARKLAQIKEQAYILGNIAANPVQGFAFNKMMGGDYTTANLIADMIIGPFLGAEGLKHLRTARKNELLNFETVQAAALVQEAYDNKVQRAKDEGRITVQTEPQRPVTAEPAKADPESIADIANTVIDTDIPSTGPEQATINGGDAVPKVDLGEPEAAAAIEAIGPIHKVGEIFSTADLSGLTPIQARVVDKIQSKIGDTEVVIAKIPEGQGRAYYDPSTKQIVIDQSLVGTEQFNNAVLHEGLHALLSHHIATNPELNAMAVAMRDMLVKQPWFRAWAKKNPRQAQYMLQDANELLAGMVDNYYGVADLVGGPQTKIGKIRQRALSLLDKDYVGSDAFTKAFDQMLAVVEKPDAQPAKQAAEQAGPAKGFEPGSRAIWRNMPVIITGMTVEINGETYYDVAHVKDLATWARTEDRDVPLKAAPASQLVPDQQPTPVEQTQQALQNLYQQLEKYNNLNDDGSYNADIDRVLQQIKRLERYIDDAGPEGEQRLNMFADVAKAINYKPTQDPIADHAVATSILAFVDKARSWGVDSKIAVDFVTSEIFEKDGLLSANTSAVEKINILNKRLDNVDQAMFDQLRQQSLQASTDPTQLIDENWLNKPFFDKKHLAGILYLNTSSEGAVKAAEDIEGWISDLMNNPLTFVDNVVEMVDKAGVHQNLSAEQQAAVVRGAKKWATNYFRNSHNTVTVKPLAWGPNSEVRSVKGLRQIRDIHGGSFHDKVAPRIPVEETIQNNTHVRQRLNTIASEAMESPLGIPWPMLNNSKHQRIVNSLTNAEMGTIIGTPPLDFSDPSKTVATAARILEKDHWFMLSKGTNGSIAVNLATLLKNTSRSELEDVVKSIEEINHLHYLGSESLWGAPGENRKAHTAVFTVGLWPMVEWARNGSVPVNAGNLESFLTDQIKGNENYIKKALKEPERIVEAIHQTVNHLRNAVIDTPHDAHKSPNIYEGVVQAVNAYYHRLWDRNNTNYKTDPTGKKIAKDNVKYAGVTTSGAQIRIKDEASFDVLLNEWGEYPSMSLPADLPAEGRTAAEQERQRQWAPYGVDLSTGTPQLKMFIVSDAFAQQNPELWEAFVSGDMLPSKLHDGASWIINENTYKLLNNLYGYDHNETGAIKFGDAGERIYKSNFSTLYDSDNPQVADFLSQLKTEGYSGIVVSSSIKSKARTFMRTTEPDGTVVVHDHDGTVLGFENNGKYDPLLADNATKLYGDGTLPKHLAINFPLTGDQSWGFILAKKGADGAVSPSLGLHRSVYNISGRSPVGVAIDKTLTTVTHKAADKAAETIAGWTTVKAIYGATRIGDKALLNNPTLLSRDESRRAGKFVKSVRNKIAKADESSYYNNDFIQHQLLLKDLDRVVLPDGSIDIPTLTAVIEFYPDVFAERGTNFFDKPVKTPASRIVKDAYDDGVKVRTVGTQVVLHPHVPNAKAIEAGKDLALKWKEEELYEKYGSQGLKGQELDDRVTADVEEYANYVAKLNSPDDVRFADPSDPDLQRSLSDGRRLTPYGQGVYIGRETFEMLNSNIKEQRADGSMTPYLEIGSKVLAKLTPSDAIDSWAPMVLLGIDNSKATGMTINNEFAVNFLGRDYDGDDLGLILESDHWYDTSTGSNDFMNLWNSLDKIGTYKGSAVKKNKVDETKLVDLKGRPFNLQKQDTRSNTGHSYAQSLDRRGEGSRISSGIALLNGFYDLVTQISKTRQESKSGQRITFTNRGQYATYDFVVDEALLEKNDEFYKQAQYDSYTPYKVDPNEVFFNSRIASIKLNSDLDAELRTELEAAQKHWESTGIVHPAFLFEVQSLITNTVGNSNRARNRNPRDMANEAMPMSMPLVMAEKHANTDRNQHSKILLAHTLKAGRGEVTGAAVGQWGKKEAVDPNALTPEALEAATKSSTSNVQQRVFAAYGEDLAVDPQAAEVFNAFERKIRSAWGGTVRFNPHTVIHELLRRPNDAPASLDTPAYVSMLNHYANSTGAAQHAKINIRKPGQMPEAQWVVDASKPNSATGIILNTADGRIPLSMAARPNGTFDPAIENLLAKGFTLAEIFPPQITGYVTPDRLPIAKDGGEHWLKMAEEKLTKNPNTFYVRFSQMNNVTKDQSYPLTRSHKNIAVLPLGAENAFIATAERAIAQGFKDIRIDLNTFAESSEKPIENQHRYLDVGKVVRSEYGLTEQQAGELIGSVAAAIELSSGLPITARTAVEAEDSYDILNGMRKAGVEPFMPDGRYVTDVLFSERVASIRESMADNATITPAVAGQERLGLFGGNIVGKIVATNLGVGRASGIHRLNKLLGRPIHELSGEELDQASGTVAKFLTENYPDATPETIDAMLHGFAGSYITRMEAGPWEKLRNGPESAKAEQYIKAQKALIALQMMVNADQLATIKEAGKLNTLAANYNFYAKQGVEDRILLNADDLRIFDGDEVINTYSSMSYGLDGKVQRSSRPVFMRDTYDQDTKQPNFKKTHSETWVRAGYRNRYIQGLKDQLKISAQEHRKRINELFHVDIVHGKPTLTPEAHMEVEDIMTGMSDLIDAQGNRVPYPEMRFEVNYDGQTVPELVMHLGNETFRAGNDGYLTAEALDAVTQRVLPTGVYRSASTGLSNDTAIQNALRFAVITKMQSMKQAAYMDVLAQSIKSYVDNLVATYGEEALGHIPDMTRSMVDDLASEVNDRLTSTISQSSRLNRYVDYNDYSQKLHDLLGELRKLDDGERAVRLGAIGVLIGGKYAAADPDDIYRLLRSRMNKADKENSQMSRTSAFHERILTGEEPSQSYLSDLDAHINNVVFGVPIQYDADMLFQLDTDAVHRYTNKINMLMLGAYRQERAVREMLGLPVLKNQIAENNMLNFFVTDDMVWNKDRDVHSSKGLRSKLSSASNEGRRVLTSQETGIPRGTPVTIAFTVAEKPNAEGKEVISLQGEFMGVFRAENKVVFNKALQEATQESQERGNELPAWADRASYAPYRDYAVVANRETGSLNYIDLSSVNQMVTGERHGMTARFSQKQRSKYFEKAEVAGMDLMEYLADGVSALTYEGIDKNGQRISTRSLRNAETKDIPFFAEITRKKQPSAIARRVEDISNAYRSFPTMWRYLLGSEAFNFSLGIAGMTAGAVTANPAVIAASSLWTAKAVGSAVKKVGKNALGNSQGYRLRSMIESNARHEHNSGNAVKDMVKTIGNMFTKPTAQYEGAQTAVTSARIGSSAGLFSEATATNRSTIKETAPYLYALKTAERISGRIQEQVKKAGASNMEFLYDFAQQEARRGSSKDVAILASIRDGRISLHAEDAEGKLLGTLSDLRAMNLSPFNLALTFAGNPKLTSLTAPLKVINNYRNRMATYLGSTEQYGVSNAAAQANEDFTRLQQNRDALSNQNRRIAFMQAAMDVQQGKFDERPLDMQTPFGRLRTLFSQYNVNFGRRTTIGWAQEAAMTHYYYKLFAEDQQFARSVATLYGIDLGDEIVQTTFTGFKIADDGTVLSRSLASRSVALQAMWPLLKYGAATVLASMLPLVEKNEWLRDLMTSFTQTSFEGVVGDNTLVGGAIEAAGVVAGMSGIDTSNKKGAKQADRAAKQAFETFTAPLPTGMLYNPAMSMLGLFGLWSLQQASVLPKYDEAFSEDKFRREGELLFLPLVGPGNQVVKFDKFVTDELNK